MKTLILILLSAISYSQNTTIHFYYGTENTAGAEIMFLLRGTDSAFLGGGFSGALKQKQAFGEINAYDLKQTILSDENESWCSLYLSGSFGFLKTILLKYRGGLAVYNNKITFLSGSYEYTKIDHVVYKPMLGVSAMYSITDDFGIEAGFDTFNKCTVGLTVNF